MALPIFNRPSRIAGKRNWIENFFTETNDFFRNFDFDKENDVPAVNVKEEPENFMIEVAVPGMKKEDFKIEIDRGVLTISAKAEENKEEKSENFVRREFSYRNFNRSFWLPENVKSEAINATYDQGMLKLKLPKISTLPNSVSKVIQIV